MLWLHREKASFTGLPDRRFLGSDARLATRRPVQPGRTPGFSVAPVRDGMTTASETKLANDPEHQQKANDQPRAAIIAIGRSRRRRRVV